MPAPGLTKAIEEAVKQGAKGAKVVRPGEAALIAKEAEKKAAEEAASAAKAAGEAPKPSQAEPVAQAAEPAAKPTGEAAPAVSPQLDPSNDVPPPVSQAAPKPIPPPTPAIPVDQQARKLANANLGDFQLDDLHHPNFDVMEDADSVKATIATLAEQNKVRIEAIKGPVETNKELLAAAAELSVSPEALMTFARTPDGAFDRATILAARQVQSASASRIYDLSQKITGGTATDMEKVQFARQIQLHNAVRGQLAGAESDWGRAGHAFRIPVGGDATQAARIKEILASGGADIDKLANAISMTDSVEGITEIAKGGLLGRVGAAGIGLTNRIFVNGILSGLATHLVNTMGNALYTAMNSGEIALAARLGRMLPGEEHIQAGEALATLQGTLGATKDALRLSARALKTGHTLDDVMKFELPGQYEGTLSNLPELDKPYIGRIVSGVDAVIGAPTRVLGAEDEFFKTLAYRADLQRQALLHVHDQLDAGLIKIEDAQATVRNFMENTPEESQKAAEDWAREITFQSPLGPTGQKFQAALRSVPVLTMIAPFIRTPTNIFKQAIYRSPMAVFSQKFWKDVEKGGRARDLALTRFAMGSGTAAVVANMVADGTITGAGPADPNAMALWQANGRRPYSIRVENPVTHEVTYHSYARMEPFASVVGSVADTVEIMSYLDTEFETLSDDETQANKAAGAIIAGIMNNTGNKTFMQGVANFVELTNDPARNIGNYSKQFVSSMVPYSALSRYVRTTQDPYLREAWTILDKIKDNTPWKSQELAARLDFFGEPRLKNSSSLVGTMSPIPESPEKYDGVVKELTDVMARTNMVPVTMPAKRIGAGGGLPAMRLTAQEYVEYVRIARKDPIFDGDTVTFHDKLQEVMDSEVYQNAAPVMRFDLLKQVQTQADEIGRIKLEEQNLGYAERIADWRLQQERLRFGQ